MTELRKMDPARGPRIIADGGNIGLRLARFARGNGST